MSEPAVKSDRPVLKVSEIDRSIIGKIPVPDLPIRRGIRVSVRLKPSFDKDVVVDATSAAWSEAKSDTQPETDVVVRGPRLGLPEFGKLNPIHHLNKSRSYFQRQKPEGISASGSEVSMRSTEAEKTMKPVEVPKSNTVRQFESTIELLEKFEQPDFDFKSFATRALRSLREELSKNG